MLDIFATGSPPAAFAPWPELQVDPFSAIVVGATSDLAAGLNLDLSVPPSPPGISLLLQGVAFAPSLGNPLFAATDGHEVQR